MKKFAIAAVPAMLMILSASPAAAHNGEDHSAEMSRVEAMRSTTLAFLASLDEAQRASAVTSLDDNEARTGWSNLPVSMAPRTGVAVADMSAEQRKAFHAMLAAALSSQGYLKSATIFWHEDVLHDLGTAAVTAMPDTDPRKAEGAAFMANYDSEKFFAKVYGDPAGADWAWTVTGHHYAANFTVSGGRIAFTPLFLGANPQIVPDGRYAGWRILQHEADRAMALLGSLREEQKMQAVLADAVDDQAFLGKGRQDRLAKPAGIAASQLTAAQLEILNGLIDEYLGDASDEAAARQRQAIEADGYDKLYFAWWGPVADPAARYMFRVQGPSILIDYVRESSGRDEYNHVHSIVRDPANDYGAVWLERHYQEAHQN
jgi:hypothetical protein